VFVLAAEYETVAKVCLSNIVAIVRRYDQRVWELYARARLPGHVAVQFSTNACAVLQELLFLFVTNDRLALHAAIEVRGFHFLLDRLGLGAKQQQI
jgi:hypothetical protein